MCIFRAVMLIIVIIVMSRKRSKDRRGQFVIQLDRGDLSDEKRHYKYDIQKANDDSNKHLKENNIHEELAQGAMVNPTYELDGTVTENPT